MSSESGLTWGINGHPSYQDYQQLTIPQQIALLHQLGLTSYRVDIYNADADTVAMLTQLESAAKPLGISILPVLVPAAAASGSTSQAYQWGYQTASALAAAFPSMTWEIGNEVDEYVIKPGADGESSSDYDDTKFSIAESFIKGMSDGVKTDPAARTIVDITGLHFGFLDRLSADGVTWDITGEHYYVAPNDTNVTNELGQVFGKLASYGKPLELTELDQQEGSQTSQASQATALTDIMQTVSADAGKDNITAAYIYELLDQPDLSGGEADYGIATSTGSLKPAGQAVQTYLANSSQSAGGSSSRTGSTSGGTQPAAGGASTGSAQAYFNITDSVTGAALTSNGSAYTGTVANIARQYLWSGTDSVAITAGLPNVFIRGGSGNDALTVTSGNNVLDGGRGSNFLIGTTAGKDAFSVDVTGTGIAWDTIVNFHRGDQLTIVGFKSGVSTIGSAGTRGTAGYTGATFSSELAGAGTGLRMLVTFAGVDTQTIQAHCTLTPGSLQIDGTTVSELVVSFDH